MGNKLLFLPALIFAVACQPKTISTEQPDSLVIDSSSSATAGTTLIRPAIAPTTFDMGDWDRAFDVLVDANGRLYKEPDSNSDIITEVQSLTPFSIEGSTPQRLPDDVDPCDRYYWYQVTLPNKIKGWVYGADVKIPYSYSDENLREMDGFTFEFNKNEYEIQLLTDAGIGPDDENGLTSCTRLVTPYLYKANDHRLYFIKAFDAQLTHSPDLLLRCYPNQLAFTESEGGSSKLIAVAVSDARIQFTVGVYYQEGGGRATLQIIFKDGGFELESFIFEETKGPH